MHRSTAESCSTDSHIDLSFSDVDGWQLPADLLNASRAANSPLRPAAILFGDDRSGPAIHCFALPPDVFPPDAEAHSHASDTWRISLRGELPMGRETYGPGEFRFQQGWRPYPSDNYAMGPAGGWSLVMFGDRRGMRVRPVKGEAAEVPLNRMLAAWLDIRGDLVSEEPSDTCGSSGLVSDLGDPGKPARITGSFSDTSSWSELNGNRISVSLMGHPETGPVVVLVKTEPDTLVSPPSSSPTEVFRVIVEGSCSVGDETYGPGDMRLQVAGTETPRVTSGPSGVSQVLTFGDRSRLQSELGTSADSNTHHVCARVADLLEQLNAPRHADSARTRND